MFWKSMDGRDDPRWDASSGIGKMFQSGMEAPGGRDDPGWDGSSGIGRMIQGGMDDPACSKVGWLMQNRMDMPGWEA